MFRPTTRFAPQTMKPQSAHLLRLSLRILGLMAWLLFVLFGLMATGCRITAPLPTLPLAAVSPLPTVASNGSAVLPAPLYFLPDQGQIMRLETDGVTLHQITNEATPIIAFDVDPTGAYLVYVSNNDLIRTDAWGAARQLLFAGGPLGEPNSVSQFANDLHGVAFAPDGKRLVFERNGIQLLQDITAPDPAATLQALLPNGPDPSLPPGAALYFLHDKVLPSSWSPDGKYLFVAGSLMNTDAYEHMLLEVATGQLVAFNWNQISNAVTNGQTVPSFCYTGPGISTASWDRRATQLYSVNNFTEMFGPPSLSVIPVTDGTVTPLFYSDPACDTADAVAPSEGRRQFRATYSTTKGALWGFVNTNFDPALTYDPPLTMVQFDPATKQITPLRSDSYFLEQEILWDPQDRGAVVIVREPTGTAQARLVWLPSDGSPAVDLEVSGQWLPSGLASIGLGGGQLLSWRWGR